MPVFPSVEWFSAVADVINHDDAFRHLGSCDSDWGVEFDDTIYRLTFEGWECINVEEVKPSLRDELDFTLVLPSSAWKEMLEDIRAHGRATLDHTLNTIDLNIDDFARARDFYLRDKFYRFNQSFQNFFDASAKIETQFADEKAGAPGR
jgi:hypothetical protein